MRIASFYSQFRGIAVEDVWHDNNECQIGLAISAADRLPGTNNRPQCAYCVLHNMPRDKARLTTQPSTSSPSAMQLRSLSFTTGGHCNLTFEKQQGWLRATWTGQINNHEAIAGAQNYLSQVGPFHCLYLLNDNSALRGPWFDSIEWLEQAWLPQALQLGLRYIAHVVQTDTHNDILTLNCPLPSIGIVELQVFDDVPSAEAWLYSCQQPRREPSPPFPLT